MTSSDPTPGEALPRATVLLGPSRSGKTRECVERFRAAGGRALLVVPSAEARTHLLATLALSDSPESPDERVYTFERLARAIARPGAGRPASPASRRTALEEAFGQTVPVDGYFGAMHGSAGFVAALGGLIHELKLSSVSARDLGAATQRLRDERPGLPLGEATLAKLDELCRLYAAYDARLTAAGMCDEDDVLAAALSALAAGAPVPGNCALLLVDGFRRWEPAWLDLLAALGRRGAAVVLTLTAEAERPLLFAAPLAELDALRARFSVAETRLLPADDRRPEPLRTLERRLFTRTDAPGNARREGATAPHVVIYDAPNRYVEAEMVARALVRERRDHGTRWSRCAVIARSAGQLAPLLENVCDRFDVPLSITYARALADSTVGRALLSLCAVLARGWRRDDLIAWLRSSAADVDRLGVEWLLRRARRAGVRAGPDAWRRLAGPADASVGRALAMLAEWHARVGQAPRTRTQHGEQLVGLLEEAGFAGLRDGADRAALAAARDAIGALGGAGADEMLPFAAWVALLEPALQQSMYRPPPRPDAVHLAEPGELHGEVTFAAVIGLTERVFPRRAAEDPFLRDDERAALAGATGIRLAPRAERADAERFLFYLAVTTPAERLVLAVPRSSDEADALPSFYLDEVRAALGRVDTVIRTLADVAPSDPECVTERDRLLAACAAEGAIDPGALGPQGVPRGRIERVLASRGRPRVPAIEDESVRRALALPRRYGVTEIEAYLRCPFQHFARYALRLRPEGDGTGRQALGTLLHAALRRGLGARAPRQGDGMREALRRALDASLDERPVDAPRHRARMLRRALDEGLDGFVEREERYGPAFGLTPAHFELAFGLEPEAPLDDEEVEEEAARDYDPASTRRPLRIEVGGQAVDLCGAIDRVDLDRNGSLALVMDYKSGASVPYPSMRDGLSVQIPLYLFAAESLWGWRAGVGCYDSMREDGRRRVVRTDVAPLRIFGLIAGAERADLVKPVTAQQAADMRQAATESVLRAASGIEAGHIVPSPGDHCKYCAYADVCRTTQDGIHDGEPLAEVARSGERGQEPGFEHRHVSADRSIE